MIAEVDRAQEILPALLTETEARAMAGSIRRGRDNLRALCIEFEQREGWKALSYPSMRACALAEFGWSWRQFYRQLAAANVERDLGVSIGQIPESHARELARLPAGERAGAYTAAGDGATAADVRAEVDRRLPREEPLPEPFAALGEPASSGTAFNTDLPTGDDPAPLCHNCGELVPGALEDGLPAICEKCAPGYYEEPPEEAPVAVTETVGTPQSPGIAPRAQREAQHASTVPVGSQDHPAAPEAVSRQATGFDEEDRLLGEIDYAEIRRNGDTVGVVMAVYREVIARAQEQTRAAMAFRATLQKARGGR